MGFNSGFKGLNDYSSLIPFDISFQTSHTKGASRPLSLVAVLFADTVATYTLFVQWLASSELHSAFPSLFFMYHPCTEVREAGAPPDRI